MEKFDPRGMTVEEIEKRLEGVSEFEKKLFLAELVFLTSTVPHAPIEDDEGVLIKNQRLDYIVRTYHNLLMAMGFVGDWGGVYFPHSRMYEYHSFYYDHFIETAGRSMAAEMFWKLSIPRMYNVIEIMYNRVEKTEGLDTDAARELRSFIDLAGKVTGFHAPEKLALVGGGEEKPITLSQVHEGRKLAMKRIDEAKKLESGETDE